MENEAWRCRTKNFILHFSCFKESEYIKRRREDGK